MTYSLLIYISHITAKEMDISLAKAMYEFGSAASTYREYLIAKYDPENPEVTTYTATFKADGITIGEATYNMLTEKIDEPKEVMSTHVIIDSTWWGDFNYRGFNIKKSGITLEEAAAAFVIYIPVVSAE